MRINSLKGRLEKKKKSGHLEKNLPNVCTLHFLFQWENVLELGGTVYKITERPLSNFFKISSMYL